MRNMNNLTAFWGLLLCIASLGCASSQGFNRGQLRDTISQTPVIDNAEIAAALAKKPQLPKPFRIAVHFREPQSGHQWRWQEANRKEIYRLEEKLKVSGEVSAVFPLAGDLVIGDRVEDLRMAAAQQGADALLVVSGTSAVDRYTGKFGWTYAALVTTLFVPASTYDALFMTRASLWDVRNGFLYMTAEAEDTKSHTAPLAWIEEKPLIDKSKDSAIGLLAAEIGRQIEGLLGASGQVKIQ